MEWIVKNSNRAKEEISAGNYDKIRLFTGPVMSYSPEEDVSGGPWQVCLAAPLETFRL